MNHLKKFYSWFSINKKTQKIQRVSKNVIIKKKKHPIPKALREQVWLKNMGKYYKGKCIISWCKNEIDVFNFHVGHNIPECKGGQLNLKNLYPICARCNLSMSKNYSIDEWINLSPKSGFCNII